MGQGAKAKKQQNLQGTGNAHKASCDEKKLEVSVKAERGADKEQSEGLSNERSEREKEGDDLDLQKPPSEVFRGAASGMLDLLSQALGGDSMADGMKELLDNAEAASIDKSISMLQAHRTGADQATIKLLQRADAVPYLHGNNSFPDLCLETAVVHTQTRGSTSQRQSIFEILPGSPGLVSENVGLLACKKYRSHSFLNPQSLFTMAMWLTWYHANFSPYQLVSCVTRW